MLTTIPGIEIEVGNSVFEGEVECDFNVTHHDPGRLSGLPENCYPAEMECYIKVLDWDFGDEEGEDVGGGQRNGRG